LPVPDGPAIPTHFPAATEKLTQAVRLARFRHSGTGSGLPRQCWLGPRPGSVTAAPSVQDLRFRLGQGDIGNALAVHRQHDELDNCSDEAVDPARELVLVGQECDKHSDAQIVNHDRSRAKVDDDEPVHSEQARRGCVEQYLHFLYPQIGIDPINQVVDPHALPAAFQVQRLAACDTSCTLHEMALLLRGVNNRLLRAGPERSVGKGLKRGVDRRA
jgi:hypothetical protein